MFDALIRTFPAPHDGPTDGDSTDEPIFIIGMPRTGTTLLDRVLSSHPDVYSAGELQNFPTALQRASGSRLPLLFEPDIVTYARAIDWRQIGATYLANTRPATADRPRFIDKLPHNFLYAGFIARALPRAKIICLRRDPLDACLGNFRHLFDRETPFYDYSFDVLDTGRYYIQFDRLMVHWKNVLPGRIWSCLTNRWWKRPKPLHANYWRSVACHELTPACVPRAIPHRSTRPMPGKCARRSIAPPSAAGNTTNRNYAICRNCSSRRASRPAGRGTESTG
jgi:hypothetical protein